MKVVQVNAYCERGSTGKICVSISEVLTKNGIENYVMYSRGTSDKSCSIKYGLNQLYTRIQSLKSRIFGNNGFNCHLETKRLINQIERIKPEVVHLHNLHAQNCNLTMLIRYLKDKRIKVIWTFHDCWIFTGYCMYFDYVKCNKWKESCGKCPQRKKYSWFIDRSRSIKRKKEKLFSGLDIVIVTPSLWLKKVVEESFFQDYKIRVINNGLNLEVFKPTKSRFRENNNLEGYHIVLGVADIWDKRKGLDTFIEISKRLEEQYKVVLVGVTDKIANQLPDNVLSIMRTNSQEELIGIYSEADVFVNPTIDEVFGMVNIESLACGTPVIMYNTGGSPECIDSSCGVVVEKHDIESMIEAIKEICENKIFKKENCVTRAKKFDEQLIYADYMKLYLEIMSKR